MELDFECTKRNFDSFENSRYDTEAALYLRIDVANACGEIARNITYSERDTQIRLMLQTAIGILEMVGQYVKEEA